MSSHKFFKALLLLIIVKEINAEAATINPTTTLEDDFTSVIPTTMESLLNSTENAEEIHETPSMNEITEAMEKLTELLLLTNESNILNNFEDILNSTSIITYLLNDSVVLDGDNITDKMLEKFKSTKEKFLIEFMKNHLIFNSTQKRLETLFALHNYTGRMPTSINSYLTKYSEKRYDSLYLSQIPETFYEALSIDSKNKNVFSKTIKGYCKKIDTFHLYYSIASGNFILQTFLYNIIKNEYFTDQIIDLIHEFVISLVKQISMIDAICVKLFNGFMPYYTNDYIPSTCIYTIKDVLEKLNNTNLDQKKKFWANNITIPLIQRYLDLYNDDDNNKIAQNLFQGFKQNYTKTGYVFGVGVYKSINGNFDHAIYGNDVFVVSNYTKKNVFIMRTEASKTYKPCSILNLIEDYEAEICQETTRGRNLPSLIKWLHKKCPDLAAIAIVRNNLDFHGFTSKNGIMSKNIQFKKCYFAFTLTIAFKANK